MVRHRCRASLRTIAHHNASPVPPLTIGGTVLKKSDVLVILGVTFDSKMTFEEYLRSVSRVASPLDTLRT